MDQSVKVALLLVLLTGFACTVGNALSTDSSYEHCENIVKNWASSSLLSDVIEDKHILKHLLFFLHVPRTGGRTYYHCFLRKLYDMSFECPLSYDKFRFNRSNTDCRLLTSHDDYSVMSKLPVDRTSVMTILRNPVERFFSSYEFSIEVAARYLIYPNITAALNVSEHIKTAKRVMTTMEIWPWKYLVPWMRDDLFARQEARKQNGTDYSHTNDLYNAEDIVMPLTEYIHHPIALDIIHNGATFQIAGLTNNSNLRESHGVRHCVMKYRNLGDHVLEVAKRRLDNMLYVGLTESHDESTLLFANVVGAQVIDQLLKSNLSEELAAKNESAEHVSSFPDPKSNTPSHQNFSWHPKEYDAPIANTSQSTNKIITVEGLHEAYKKCVPQLRKVQFNRRNSSFHKIPPSVNFNKEARRRVPEVVLQEIASLNSLDVELYKHAQSIFAKQHKHMVQNKMGGSDIQKNNYMLLFDVSSWKALSLVAPSWKTLSLATVVALSIFVFLLVNVRRTKLKLKI